MNPLLLILHLEDSPRDAELVRDNLRKASVDCELRVACDRAEYEAALVQARFDLILSDYKLPNYDGLAALALAREKQPEVPFILISGTLGEEAAVDCLKRGATDYVLKHRLERLVPAVRRALQEAQERRARIQAEEASRVSEEQFRAMFEVASIGMAQADPRTGQWLRVNQKMCEITGYPAAELLGKRVSELTHPDDRQKDSEAFQRVVRGDAPDYRMEKRYLRKDGAVVWVNVNMTVIRDAASQPTRTMATIEEITERKQAEQRVRELNRVLRATGAVNALMARERDPKRLLAEASQILVDTRGYRFVWIGLVEAGSKRVVPQARAGKDTGYFDTVTITWDETPAGQGPIGTAIRTGQLVACQDIATDPRSASYRQDAVARGIASMAALPMIYGSRVLGAVAVYSERTGSFDAEELDLLNELAGDLAFALQSIEHEQERKHLEEALRESSQLNQQIIASAQEGIIVYGRDLKYQAWNPFMEQHSGLPAREVLGKHPLELFPFLRDAGVLASIEKALAGEPTPTTDFPYENTRSGKSGWALAMHGPLRNAAGEIIGVIGIVRDITERKQADEKLARSHEHYRRAITAASAIPYQKDYASDTYVFIGEEIRDVTGYAPSELRSAVWKEMVLGTVFLGETAELSAAEAARRAVAGEIKNWRADHRIRTRSGEIRWISDSSISVLDASGKYAGSMGIIQDITERKRAEIRVEAFSKLGLRLSAAKTAREAAGIICETASELLGWDACLFGLYSPSKALLDLVLQVDTIDGRRVEFSPGYQPPSVTARRAMETGGQLILKEKPGEMLPGGQPFGDSSRPSASIMYVPIRKGAEVVGALSIQSYTPQAYDQRSLETLQSLADHCGGALDRVRMTQAWQTTQERLGHLLTQSPAVIYSLKTDGITTGPAWVSDNVERLLGYTVAECHGPEGLFSRLHPQDRQGVTDGLVQLFANRQIARDFRVRHKNGEYRWVRDEQRLVGDASGAPVEIVGSWVDITERKGIEEQLRQSQKLEAVGQLAGGVAHDFNNLLAVIRSNAELLLMTAGDLTADANESLTEVVNASERAANLTRQLLAFSRKQVLQLEPLLLNEVVENLTKMLKRILGENIDLQCHYAARLPCVQADTSMMEQVILNLVVNARDAMPAGGLLRVATHQTRRDEEQAPTHPGARAGDFVCLMVSDTGTGIGPEVLPHIFEPFFTTKEVGKGTGLGLAMVYGIVQQHQGWIEVISKVGEGTVFKVFLPVIPTPDRPEGAAQVGTDLPGGTETILLVEDDHSVRQSTRRVLQSKGYKIWEAGSAQEASELWDRHAGEIALLLTDIVMPGKISGRDLADRLWGQSPGLRVIFMSGYSADVMGRNTDSIQRTRSPFLQKPCSARALLETVRRCLDAGDSTAASAAADHAK